MKWSILALIALALVGCDDQTDKRPCIKSHEEMTLMPMIVGQIIMMMPQYDTVCDKRKGDK